MLNKAFVIGRLVRDPEMRMTASGVALTQFTVAVDKPYKNEQGERGADFLRVVTWRRLAEIAGQYLKKGKLVAIVGRLQMDNYEKDGQLRQSAQIVADNFQMLDRATSPQEDMVEI